MATIYTHYTDADTDYYLSLESMTTNGYFPLTIMQGNSHDVTLYDDLSTVTGEMSQLLMKNAGMSRDDVIKVLEQIVEFFDGSDTLEVWANEDDEPPYILIWDEDEDED